MHCQYNKLAAATATIVVDSSRAVLDAKLIFSHYYYENWLRSSLHHKSCEATREQMKAIGNTMKSIYCFLEMLFSAEKLSSTNTVDMMHLQSDCIVIHENENVDTVPTKVISCKVKQINKKETESQPK